MVPILLTGLYAQEPSSQNNRLVFLAEFSPFKSETNPQIADEIYQSLTKQLEEKGFKVVKSTGASTNERLKKSKEAKAFFYIDGYYIKPEGKNLNIYIQTYNPETGYIIDAIPQFQEYAVFEGVEWDAEEVKNYDQQLIQSINKRLVISLQSNSQRAERRAGIESSILHSPISEIKFNLSPEESGKALAEVFRYLSEDNSISIVSKRVGQSESAERASAIVSVISRRKIIDSGARNLVDILKSLPGVEVFYDQFGFYKVAFRGIRSKSGVLLMIDGHRINNFYDGSTFLDIRADAIEKVEVIRGPSSSIHGTNALVGVINVITRDLGTGKNSQGVFSTRAGSQNTLEPSAFYSQKMGQSDWRLSLYGASYQSKRVQNHIGFDDTCSQTAPSGGSAFKGLSACNLTVFPLYMSSWIKTNDHKKQNNAFLKIQNGKEGFFVTGKFINETRGPNMGEISVVAPNSELNFNFMNGSVGFDRIAITDSFSFSAKIYGDSYFRKDDIEVERKDYKTHIGMSAKKRIAYNYSTKGGEAVFQYNPLPNLVFMLGLQYEKLAVKNFYMQQNYLSSINTIPNIELFYWDYDALPKDQNKERTIQGEFLQAIWDPLKWLSFTIGVRRDRYSDFGKTINPKGGIVIIPFEKSSAGTLTIKFLGGSAFRAPTFQELYDKTQQYQQGGILGNSNLKPESIKTYEVGAEYNTPYTPLTVMLNGFFNKISNNIDGFNQSGVYPGKTDTYLNLRGISVIGYEAEARLSYSQRNYGFINGSWVQTIDYGGIPPADKVDTTTFRLDIPQARGNLGINHELTKYFTLNNSIWVSSERASNSRYSFESQDNKVFRIPQYHIWNISLNSTEDLWKNVFLSMTVFNANNYKLYDEVNVPTGSFYPNRVIPSGYLWGRYLEFKFTYSLD